MNKTVYSPLGQTFDDYLKETGRHEVVHALAHKKIAAFKAAQTRKRKLAAQKKAAAKKKKASLASSVIKFINTRKKTSAKRSQVARYAKSRSRTAKKI